MFICLYIFNALLRRIMWSTLATIHIAGLTIIIYILAHASLPLAGGAQWKRSRTKEP